MFNFFKKREKEIPLELRLKVDMHSHLIPAVDDGSQSIEESLLLLESLHRLGYKKFFITPHIMSDYYKNDKESLIPKLLTLREAIEEKLPDVIIDIAAEYYIDEGFFDHLKNKEQLLTFGKNYLLIETPFLNEPSVLRQAVFDIKSLDLIPVLAHPERYMYIHEQYDIVEDLRQRGVLLQVNIKSLVGYYSTPVKKVAERMIDEGIVSFLGSDCHNHTHFKVIEKAIKTKYYRKALELNLLNNHLE